jgi:hypothetical protein
VTSGHELWDQPLPDRAAGAGYEDLHRACAPTGWACSFGGATTSLGARQRPNAAVTATLAGEAVQWPFDPEVEMPKLLADGRHHAGRHLAGLFVRTWDSEGSRNPILILLRAATTEPQAAEMLREFLRLRLFAPLMDRLGSERPELRTDLVASQRVGLGIARYVLRLEPIASAEPENVIAWISPTLQRYLTGKLEP